MKESRVYLRKTAVADYDRRPAAVIYPVPEKNGVLPGRAYL